MTRPALFAFVGVAFCVRSVQSFADPDFEHPESAADWFSVLSFSVALIALALALPLFAQLVGGRWVRWAAVGGATGAAGAGLANLLEDALQLGFAFWLFSLSATIFLAGLVALTAVTAVTPRGLRRLFGLVPAATLAGLLLFESGGGALVLVAWLVAAGLAVSEARARRAAPQPAPAVP